MNAANSLCEVSAPTTSAGTSAQSLRAIGLHGFKSSADKVFDICLAAQRNGAADLSLSEIRSRYELQHSHRFDLSSVSGRVSNLVSAGRLERLSIARPCSVTGRNILPVRVPMVQTRLMP